MNGLHPRRWWAAGAATALALLAVASLPRLDASRNPHPGDYSLQLVDGHGRRVSNQNGTLRLALDPFTVYRNAPSQTTSSYTIDERGFRGPKTSSEHPKVFVVGGSAVFGQDLEHDQDTLTAHMARNHPTVNVINAGVVGYLSGQELASMVHYLDEYHPVGYVVLDGWNEVFDQWHFAPRGDLRLGFCNAFFAMEDHLHTHFRGRALGAETRPAYHGVANDQYFNQLVQNYHANIARMHAFARSRNAFFLLIVQPELGMKVIRTSREEAAWGAFENAYRYAERDFTRHYRRLVERTREFCQSEGIPCHTFGPPDFAGNDQELFLDPVHLSARGTRWVSDAVSPTLDALLACQRADTEIKQEFTASKVDMP